MSNQQNQINKEVVWDFWQKLNHVGVANVPDVVRAAVHDDVDWNVSAPIDRIVGVEASISDFWLPLLHAFPDLQHRPYIFMGGIDEGSKLYATNGRRAVGFRLRVSDRQLRERLARDSRHREKD